MLITTEMHSALYLQRMSAHNMLQLPNNVVIFIQSLLYTAFCDLSRLIYKHTGCFTNCLERGAAPGTLGSWRQNRWMAASRLPLPVQNYCYAKTQSLATLINLLFVKYTLL